MSTCPIIFDPDSHTYTRKSDGAKFVSVTTFIGKFKPKSNFDQIAERIAIKRGTDKKEILKEWDEIKNKGLDFGNRIHLNIQNYLEGGECNSELIEFLKKMQNDHKLQSKKLLSEHLVYDMDHQVAGMSDLIAEYIDNNFF